MTAVLPGAAGLSADDPSAAESSTGGPSTGAARAERVLIRALALFRAGGMVEIAVVLGLDWRHYASLVPVLALVAAVAAESTLLVVASWRRGRVSPLWMSGDIAFLVAGLAVGAELTAPADGHTWVYFMYPLTVITCFGIGIAYLRLSAVLGATAALAVGYSLSAIIIHHDPAWNVMPNAVTYFANTAVAWAVARELRRGGRAHDAWQAEAVRHAADLARERERARHARLLHDHVLQTFEFLVSQRAIADDDMHEHIASDAAWLRALVEGTAIDEPGDLLARLQSVIQHQAAAGLRVEFTNAQLLEAARLRRSLPPAVADAVVDAVGEALANVSKHARVDTAIMRAAVSDDQLIVTVLDHGTGFDLMTARRGLGLDKSITERIEDVGGSARIESIPGEGTYVELTIPATAWRTPAAGHDQGAGAAGHDQAAGAAGPEQPDCGTSGRQRARWRRRRAVQPLSDVTGPARH